MAWCFYAWSRWVLISMSLIKEFNLFVSFLRYFLNLYVGWGQKYELFNPTLPSLPAYEWPKEFLEKNDPSIEAEKAFEQVQHEQELELMSEEYMSADENEEYFEDEDENDTIMTGN